MTDFGSVQERNREVARQIHPEARANPQSPYAGKFVGIANGQVFTVADDWDELARHVRELEPDPRKAFCFEVGREYDAVQEIWGRNGSQSSVGEPRPTG
jgi:hypothetical protein